MSARLVLDDVDRDDAHQLAQAVQLFEDVLDHRGRAMSPRLADLRDQAWTIAETGKNRERDKSTAYNPANDDDEIITQREAARIAGVDDTKTIRNWMDRGLLDFVPVGRQRKLTRGALRRYLAGGDDFDKASPRRPRR